MRRFVFWAAALLAALALHGCALNLSGCIPRGDGGHVCFNGGGGGAQQTQPQQVRPIYIQPNQQYQQQYIPPVLYPQTPPLYQPGGGCSAGYQLIKGVGWVCQGRTWGKLNSDGTFEFVLYLPPPAEPPELFSAMKAENSF